MNSSISHEAYLFLLLLFLFQLSVQGAMKFTEEPPNPSYAGNGSNAKLVWDFSVDNKQKELEGIRYSVDTDGKFNAILTLTNNGTLVNLPNIPAAYNGRVRVEGRASLVIENINLQDNTQFQCTLVAKAGAGLDVVSIVQLIVTVIPQISISSVPSSYKEGSVVNITCTASGTPDPDVKWFRNGKLKSEGKKAAALTFNNVSRRDDGRYKCQANNSAGDIGNDVTLVVYYKPEGTTLTTSDAHNTVTQEGSVTFTCHVTAANPQVSRYRFYLNGTTEVKDSNDSQYNISNVQRSQHYGKYKCIPRNDVGDGPEAAVILNVNVPVQFTVLPQNLTANETNSILLSCDASGFPEPSFEWTKNGKVLSRSKQLNIQRSYRNNTGTYECTASNGVGQDMTAKSFVTVQYPPTIKHVAASSDKSWIGQTVTLTCESDGVPTPTHTWYKSDRSQINSDTATQNTVDVKMNVDGDFGPYKCVAGNGLTPADSKTVEIKQITTPGTPTIESTLDIQATSLSVKWTAPAVNGGSPITGYRVVILKGSNEIKNVNVTDPGITSLSVGDLERDTEYTVKVLARNTVFEGPPAEKKVKTKYEEPGDGGDDGTQTGEDDNGMGAAIYAGAAAAGVVLIIGIIVIIVLWRRRKPSSDEDTSRDELGSANPYESEDGYHSVSREAAQSLQASGAAAEPDYAQVDQSRKKKNRMPANDEYAQVDKSKKTKKKKKKNPGELEYADLEDLRSDIQLGPVPSGGAAAAAPIVRPPAYEGTVYADISQFGVPQPDPTYANVPKQEVVYSNVESM